MAINFTAGDIVVVKQTYVQNTLAKISPVTNLGIVGNNIKRTVSLLGQFKHDPIEVLGSGSVTGITDNALPIVWSFIRIRPVNQQSPSYQNGAGIIIYWHNDTGINDALELSSAYVKDSQAIRCKNTSGATIFKSAVVYSTGFDTASNLPTVALASAASSNTLAAFGLAEEEIINGAFGTVVIDGHYQGLNTLAFNINDIVYLSDTLGQVSAAQGTTPSIVGRCINIGASDGAIAFRGIIPLGQGVGGGGPGPQGATGIRGVTGLSGNAGAQGATGIQGNQGNQGIQGSTGVGIQGAQGTTGMMGLGTTGVQGIQGSQGVTGLRGIQGIQGTQGVTGVLGIDGITGIAGVNGATGIQGLTGIAGLTGIGVGDTFIIRDTFTGSVSDSQTAFSLSMTPSDTLLVAMEINGVTYRSTTFFTVSGTSLTWLDIFLLSSSDVVDIVYPIPLV